MLAYPALTKQDPIWYIWVRQTGREGKREPANQTVASPWLLIIMVLVMYGGRGMRAKWAPQAILNQFYDGIFSSGCMSRWLPSDLYTKPFPLSPRPYFCPLFWIPIDFQLLNYFLRLLLIFFYCHFLLHSFSSSIITQSTIPSISLHSQWYSGRWKDQGKAELDPWKTTDLEEIMVIFSSYVLLWGLACWYALDAAHS